MPRVLIKSDDGRVTLDERVEASDFRSEHFRRCLSERLWWATQDAQRPRRRPSGDHFDPDRTPMRWSIPIGTG